MAAGGNTGLQSKCSREASISQAPLCCPLVFFAPLTRWDLGPRGLVFTLTPKQVQPCSALGTYRPARSTRPSLLHTTRPGLLHTTPPGYLPPSLALLAALLFPPLIWPTRPAHAQQASTPPPPPDTRQQPAARQAGYATPPLPQQLHLPQTLFDGARVIARIGPEVVLAADCMPVVNDWLARNAAKYPPDQLEQARLYLIRQALKGLIDTKILVLRVKQKVPKEGYDRIMERLGSVFEKDELPKLIERAGVSTRAELEAKLRELGSSIERERTAFCERALTQQWIRQQINLEPEITHQEMLDYYQQHREEFEYPARARWEMLLVLYSSYPSKAEAYRAIAALGNAVLDGEPFAEVARRGSEGATAKNGGVYDWTTRGSLKSKIIDEAIFTLPVGQLSRILEDERGFAIVRVIERQEAGRIAFEDAQVKIREQLKKQHIERQIQQYLQEARKGISVWTVFDDLPDEE